jgi:hypothetical protein
MTRNVVWWLAIIWISCVIAGSLMPTSMKVAIGTTKSGPIEARPASLLHRVFHFGSFYGAAFLVLLLASSRKQEFLAAGAITGLAIGVEASQHFIMGYPLFEWWDVRDDAIGIVMALVAIQVEGVRGRLIVEGQK